MKHYNIMYHTKDSNNSETINFSNIVSRNAERAKQTTDKKVINMKRISMKDLNNMYDCEVTQVNDDNTEELHEYI